jgi:hypothetical protein
MGEIIMSRKARWCAMAFLAVAGSVGLIQADDDTYSSVKELERARRERALASQNIWWEHLVPGRIEAKKQAAQAKKQSTELAKAKADKVKKAEAADASSLQDERAKFHRRSAVCQRLREIALETNDPELEKQADLLESRAWAALEQKTATVLGKLTPMSEKDAETKLLGTEKSTEPARADASQIRSIRSDGKE